MPAVIFASGILTFFAVNGSILLRMRIKKSDSPPDYLIVLGARVYGKNPGSALRSRIDRASEYLRVHPKTIAILSGGILPGAEISEAECIRRALLENGISETRLILEERAKTTEENVRFSFSYIPENASIGILSNDFHLFRAQRIAAKVGRTVSTYSAPCPHDILVSALVRESLAVICGFLTGRL